MGHRVQTLITCCSSVRGSRPHSLLCKQRPASPHKCCRHLLPGRVLLGEGNGTPLLPGKSHGQRSLVGCSPWGREKPDTTERLHFHFSLSCIREGNGNPLQCSCLENPRDGGDWWVAVYGVTQSRTRLKQLSSISRGSSRLLTHRGHRGKQDNEALGAGLTPRLPSSPADTGLALRLRGGLSSATGTSPGGRGSPSPPHGSDNAAPKPAVTQPGTSPLTYNSWDVQMGPTLKSAF